MKLLSILTILLLTSCSEKTIKQHYESDGWTSQKGSFIAVKEKGTSKWLYGCFVVGSISFNEEELGLSLGGVQKLPPKLTGILYIYKNGNFIETDLSIDELISKKNHPFQTEEWETIQKIFSSE